MMTRMSGSKSTRYCRQKAQGETGFSASDTTAMASKSVYPMDTAFTMAVRSAQMLERVVWSSTLQPVTISPLFVSRAAPT